MKIKRSSKLRTLDCPNRVPYKCPISAVWKDRKKEGKG
jgi:hypothetical protein